MSAKPKDLRNRLAYSKPELSMVLPFGHTTLEGMIAAGQFPDGIRPHPTAHKIWPRVVIEKWLESHNSNGVRLTFDEFRDQRAREQLEGKI